MLCLHILQSSLGLVNTLMIQDTLALPEWADVLTDADRRGLTPVFHTNMTPYGEIQLRTDRRLDLTGIPPDLRCATCAHCSPQSRRVRCLPVRAGPRGNLPPAARHLRGRLPQPARIRADPPPAAHAADSRRRVCDVIGEDDAGCGHLCGRPSGSGPLAITEEKLRSSQRVRGAGWTVVAGLPHSCGLIHTETWAGSRAWCTTPARSSRTESRSTVSFSRAANAATVDSAS